MKSMKKLVLAGLVLLASVMVLVGCKMEAGAAKVYTFPAAVKVLTDYESPNNTDDTWTYVEFGEWPQTIKAASVEVTEDESKKKEMGMFTAYLGSDGNYYVKEKENAYRSGSAYQYSDGTQAGQHGTSEKWFKVEPIVWRVLNKNYSGTGKALLLAEKILIGGIPYYEDTNTRTITGEPNAVYHNNYKYSTIRAWLNGGYEDGDTQEREYDGNGFLQTAFTDEDLECIAETTVDNTARSTNPDNKKNQWENGENEYACDNTEDKIFLLSEQEATKKEYGFASYGAWGEGNTRIRVTTDYAKAIGAYQNETTGYGGCWWLRSPYYNDEDIARNVDDVGYANNFDNSVDDTEVGVVPALYIKLQ